MKRVLYRSRGPVPQQVVEVETFDPPALAPGQVRVEVLAAPINPSDLLTLTGEYGSLPPLPAVAGNEGVGRVVELAPGLDAPALGQTVLLPVGSGTWTTHLVADARALVPLPDGADPLQLAMLTVNPPTAQLLLTGTVPLQAGDWVIQNAANSAVGGYLVQLARARGVRTVNVVRRESAVADVEAMGGDVVLVDGDGLVERIRDATGEARIRLGIDAVGGTATARIADALAPGGVVVNYGAMGGEPCTVSPAALIFRGITLRGFWLAHWYKVTDAGARNALFAELVSLIASGRLKARVQAVYGIDDIGAAIGAAAAGERSGKVLLVPSGDPVSHRSRHG
ncbi:zinc-dependent alcohol dehydrogenase family protein [Marilutibacter chinensis]|uniref:enoyl-[acyl-carrier-protein] reductase n=1 Tax=Marilutibacter chinensis TaxID=2912247 RepID=A0ABS9HQL3_9GAMM|nr:zinc-dependent alcohol dehydrogenase family protein [Lysobacter chinensis]MCF7221226.1 zinc-dependent alcohol dehydrogenase family protein [Lysobacter chinensis]MCF7223033.1 zinc-dependent alcohol dehydrogenase family protein [Lysobacter chinensis]